MRPGFSMHAMMRAVPPQSSERLTFDVEYPPQLLGPGHPLAVLGGGACVLPGSLVGSAPARGGDGGSAHGRGGRECRDSA